jgi:hypothetical protein
VRIDLKKASGFLCDLLSILVILDEAYDKWKASRVPAKAPSETP